MKSVICKSGCKGWQAKLHHIYSSFEEFEAYCRNYEIHKRLGYSSPKICWQYNPLIQGSVNPCDLRKVRKIH